MNPINISIVRQGAVYRGPQPYAPAQWDYLRDTVGIRTVLKLNYESEGSDDGAAKMILFRRPLQPMDFWQAVGRPDPYDVGKAVDVVAETQLYPIYVHCTHGHDRTGLVIGEWRVLHCGWPVEQAYQEMIEYGFHPELLDLLWTWEQFKESREVK